MSRRKAIKTLVPDSLPGWLRARQQTLACSRATQDLLLEQSSRELRRRHPNPLCGFGAKTFSQADENGITLEILRRLGCLERGVFAEFGVGNGMENNTLILKALGWKGFWVGGEPLAFDASPARDTFSFTQAWVDRDNVADLASRALVGLAEPSLDVLSLDLDGNDIYLVERLLESGFLPKLFIVEYNAKFIPPVRWQIEYLATHTWQGDDYFGASLCSFVDLFDRFGFKLVCCNAQTGANAFFARNEFADRFSDVPDEIHQIYMPPRYYLPSSFGHPPAVSTVARLFQKK